MKSSDYRFAHFVVDESRSVLLDGGNIVELEPKVFELLVFMCKNPHRLITKEELNREVWQNIAVTDNAMTRAIARLRKALGDDPKHPMFIKTLPKKGYTFLVKPETFSPVTQSSDSVAQAIPSSLYASKSSTYTRYWGLALVFALTAVAYFLFTGPPQIQYEVQPIVRNSSQAWYPSASNNAELIAYIERDNALNWVVLQNTQTQQEIRYANSGDTFRSLTMSQDGTKLAVAANNVAGNCQIIVLEPDWVTLNFRQEVWLEQCHFTSVNRLMFSANNAAVWLLHENADEIVQLYQLNANKELSPFPFNGSTGLTDRDTYFFDISEDGQFLMMLQKTPSVQTNLLLYDLHSNELRDFFELDSFIDRATLTRNGKSIIHPSEHPSYQLVQSNLKGERERLLVTISDRIEFHSRIPASDHVIFSAYLNNMDIYLPSFTDTSLQTEEQFQLDNAVSTNTNSSVMDYLPAVQNRGLDYAFVSKRTGKAEIWLKRHENELAEQLTQSATRERFYQLQWSPDDKLIAGLTSNKLLIVSASSGEAKWLPLEKAQRKNLWWRSETTLVFEEKKDDQWLTKSFDLNSNQSTLYQESYIRFLLAQHSSQFPLKLIDEHCDISNDYAPQDIQYGGHILYCFSKSRDKVIAIDANSQTVTPLFSTTYLTSFDVNDTHLIYSLQTSLSADIMRTK